MLDTRRRPGAASPRHPTWPTGAVRGRYGGCPTGSPTTPRAPGSRPAGDTTLPRATSGPESAACTTARATSPTCPIADAIAAEVAQAGATERLGSHAGAASGSYPMLLENRQRRAAARRPRVGPMSRQRAAPRPLLPGRTSSIRSPIASDVLTIVDDPTIPRGLGIPPMGRATAWWRAPAPSSKRGVLKSYNIGVYYGRKLDMAPTDGDPVELGDHRPATANLQQMAADLDQGHARQRASSGATATPPPATSAFGIRGTVAGARQDRSGRCRR